MRKPLVVVCVTASAVLLAGAVAATTAGADTAPAVPDLPGIALPEVPDVPDLPQAPAGDDAPDQGDGPHRPGGPVADPQDPAVQQPAGEQPADLQRPAQQPAAQRPAAQQPAAQNPAAQRPAAQRPAAQRPAAQAPAAQAPAAQRPGGQQPAAQRPVRPNWAAAAHQDVTRGSVSGSANSPVQREVLALVNEHRRRGGCRGVTLDRRLIAAANRHAADMARRGYFAHSSPSGDRAGDRVQDAGYRWSRYGENIARGQSSAYEVVDGWMHSPEHRENILDCELTQMGVGLAFARDDEPYWVQNFATPRR
jgi:uncharacterized protein YkwD